MDPQQGIYLSLLEDLNTNGKPRKEVAYIQHSSSNLSGISTLDSFRFDNSSQSIKYHEQLPTSLSSFIENIYSVPPPNNNIQTQDIFPELNLPLNPLPTNIQATNLSYDYIKTLNYNNASNDIETSAFLNNENTSFTSNISSTDFNPKRVIRNFQEEAELLTRRIMAGKIRSNKEDDDGVVLSNGNSEHEMMVRQRVKTADDLIIRRPKPRNNNKMNITKQPEEVSINNRIQRYENIIITPKDSLNEPANPCSVQVQSLSNDGFLETSMDFKNLSHHLLDDTPSNSNSTNRHNSDGTSLDTDIFSSNFHIPIPPSLLNFQDDKTLTNISTTSPDFEITSIPKATKTSIAKLSTNKTTSTTTTPVERIFNIDSNDEDNISLTPPTPIPAESLSLVEQLHMDKPLLDVITKKQKRGKHRCAHCPETFSTILEYAAHIDQYGIKREFKCPFPLCPWKILGLPRRSDLRRHCAIQHKEELQDDLKEYLNLRDETYPIIKCYNKYCNKEFHRKDAYNRHMAIVHQQKNSRFNKKLAHLLESCPSDLTEAEKVDYIKKNIIKKVFRSKKK